MAGLHDGHRDRMRDKIDRAGITAFEDHEVLEYLLYPFIPRRNTNEIAHALISTFGSISGVFNASAEHIAEVPGVTRNAAQFLSVLPDVFRLYAADTEKQKTSLKGRGAARRFMGTQVIGSDTEIAVAAALDAGDKLIKCERLSVGDGSSVEVSVRAIASFALRTQATGILLAHNHPSGDVRPSQSDYVLTKDVLWSLKGLGVNLLDHYIFAGRECYSFEEAGILDVMASEKDISLKEGMFYYE